jgi:hypothetical protein
VALAALGRNVLCDERWSDVSCCEKSEWWLEVLLRMCLSGCSPNTFGLDDNREVGQVAGDGERWLDQTTRRLATARPTSWPGHQPGMCSGIAGRVPALARPVIAAGQPLLFHLRRRGGLLEEPCSYCSHRPLPARAEPIAFRARAGSQTPIRYMCASGGHLAVILPSLLPSTFHIAPLYPLGRAMCCRSRR